MKKIVFLSLIALCLPWTLVAQSVVDDLYYVPSKKEKAEKKNNTARVETVVVTPTDKVVVKSNSPMIVHASDGQTKVVVRDMKGNARDIDEYNRRYDASDYEFTAQNDTLYIDEKPDDGLDGEWVGGEFNGFADDYEYATRIIRFRNPRYAISISSPLYFDVVYGLNTWDWNVYYDGLYAYAFPTFTNRLWWDWRFNSYGWWGYPYYGWGWSSWYDPWFWGGGWAWHHPHWHHPHGGWVGHPHHWGNAYTTRRSFGVRGGGIAGNRHPAVINGGSSRRTSGTSVRRTSTSNRRVVGTRGTTGRTGTVTTPSASSTRRGMSYTRPSSTRGVSTGTSSVRSSTMRSAGGASTSRAGSTYNRGSSSNSVRNSDFNNSNRNTTRTRSFDTPSRSSSRSSFSTGGGSSFRSSGSSMRSGGSRSGGGSSRRR